MRNCLLSFLLAVLMSMVSTKAFAYDAEIDGICYNFDSFALTAEVTSNDDNEYSGSMTIPESVTHEGITYSVTSIDSYAFYDCSSLTSVTIPGSVTSIGFMAFSGSSGLTSVTIPGSVTTIDEYAFEACSGLTSIIIPESVTSIGYAAFYDCSGLTSIIVEEGNTIYDSRNNCNAIIETSSNTLISGCQSTIIPNGVTSIGNNAFYGCFGLTSITIPESVTSIGRGAFSGCSGLKSITIPESLTNIGYNAFEGTAWLDHQAGGLVYIGKIAYRYKGTMPVNARITLQDGTVGIAGGAFDDCRGLASVTIPSSVTTIGDMAFEYCRGLTSITIPSSVTCIGRYAFDGCESLTSMIVEEGNTIYDSRNNCNAIIETSSNTLIYGCQRTIIPNGVTSIDDDAFFACSNLTSITIPESVTSIGICAFHGCRSLTSLIIPESVTSIGRDAFSGCRSLTSIIIPESLTEIGSFAFDQTAWLDNHADGIVYVGKVAYTYKGKMPDDYHIELQDGTIAIANYAFWLNSSLTSVTIPNSVTSIGEYAFFYCDGLTSVTIPGSVTSIGECTFYRCSSLPSVTIPGSVTSIGDGAFWGCSSLTDVYCLAEEVPETESGVFDKTPVMSATLHVPAVSLEAYRTTHPWRKFGSIVPLTDDEMDAVEEVRAAGVAAKADRYDLQGHRTTVPQRGLNIVRMSDGTVRKVLVK